MSFINGIYTVLVTPFTDNDKIDYVSMSKWLKIQMQHQSIVGLILLGTTSESPTLSNGEKVKIIKFVSKYNKQQVNPKQIVAGVGGNYTKEVINFTHEIKQYVNAIMVTVPHYNKPPQRGIVAHFQIIANTFSNLPVMMYNVPGRAGINMDPETMIEVINLCPNVVGLKETNPENTPKFIDLLKNTTRKLGDTFKLYSGDDANVIDYCKLGASGVISVASNIIPKQISDVVLLCLKGMYDLAELHLNKFEEFIKYLFVESNPIPIKEIMYYTGIYNTNHMRLPLVTMDSKKSQVLYKYAKLLTNIE